MAVTKACLDLVVVGPLRYARRIRAQPATVLPILVLLGTGVLHPVFYLVILGLLAGAVALAFLATPVVTRTTEDILRLQSNQLREAGMALGAGKGYVIRSIIWRASRSGLMTGGLLGFARISGETAPLLFTTLGNPFLSLKLTQPMAALPTTIFQFALSAYDDWRQLAWAGALIIAVAVLSANIIGRVLTRGSHHK